MNFDHHKWSVIAERFGQVEARMARFSQVHADSFNESNHPRGADGKFGSGGGAKTQRHESNFDDLGTVNAATPKEGHRRISELPFPGDTKIKAVLDDLEKNNPDWKFDLLDTPAQDVDVGSLISMQPHIDEAAVEHYRKRQDVNDRGEQNGYPTIIEHDGKRYIRNGTHRTVANILNGSGTIKARVISADAKG